MNHEEHEKECLRLIDQRDYWEGKAIELAEAIGDLLGWDVGECSSDNCPVEEALIAIEEGNHILNADSHEEQETLQILNEVNNERARQRGKWGNESDNQKHYSSWVRLIQNYSGWAEVMMGMNSVHKYRRRMLQVAAIAVASVEATDRYIDSQNTPK